MGRWRKRVHFFGARRARQPCERRLGALTGTAESSHTMYSTDSNSLSLSLKGRWGPLRVVLGSLERRHRLFAEREPKLTCERQSRSRLFVNLEKEVSRKRVSRLEECATSRAQIPNSPVALQNALEKVPNIGQTGSLCGNKRSRPLYSRVSNRTPQLARLVAVAHHARHARPARLRFPFNFQRELK